MIYIFNWNKWIKNILLKYYIEMEIFLAALHCRFSGSMQTVGFLSIKKL